MKKTLFIYFAFLVSSFLFNPYSLVAQNQTISAVSYNIRLATDSDGINAWKNRKEKFCAQLQDMQADVFGLQEVLQEQLIYIEDYFTDYGRVGVARDDGKQQGEYSPVFYNKNMFLLKKSGTFWLSQTPEIVGSRGWDAACNRVVSYAGLENIKTGKMFYVYCTHFDHMGEIARQNSVLLLLHAVDSISCSLPSIILGDFNATPNSEPYKLITNVSNPLHFIDARLISGKVHGVSYSYTGFEVNGIEPELIDYIFLKNVKKVKSFFISNKNDGKNFPSDHLPVKAILKIY